MTTEFILFPQLITELRLHIWRLALPPPIRKPLYRYRAGCWTYEDLASELDPNGEDLYMKFDTSLLEPLRIDLPLYCVNREARDVANKYIQQQNLTQSTHHEFSFIRAFDPRTDTMFLPTTDIETFVTELLGRTGSPELLNRYIGTASPVLPRLAVSLLGFEALKGERLGVVFDNGGCVDTLYIVDTADTSTFKLEGLRTHHLLELEDTPCARLIWKSSSSEWESFGDPETVNNMKESVTGLHDPGSTTSYYDLEVQRVHISRHGAA